jgi:hypothetical protein
VLAGATHLERVGELSLGFDALAEEGGIALAGWPGLRALHTLHLDFTHIGPRGAVALARSAHLGRPTDLLLRANDIGDAGAEAIAAGENFSDLCKLDLAKNAITAAGARALAASPRLGRLRRLQLEDNRIGDDGAAAIAASPHLRELRALTLRGNGVSREAGRRLIAALPDLNAFSADSGFLMGEYLEAVQDGLRAGGSEADVNAAVEDRLVQAMLDNPDDMTTRELYAKFLQDVSCPWCVVVRMQNPEGGYSDRLREIWRGHFEQDRDVWLAPLLKWAHLFDDSESLDRGFLRKVHFTGPVPDEVAKELARFPPLALLPLEVQRGNMTGTGAFQILAHRKWLNRTTRLEFRAITGTELAHVLASPHLAALEELALGPCGLGDEVVHVLSCVASAQLSVLDFGWGAAEGGGNVNRIGPDGIAHLGGAAHVRGLRALGLAGNRTVGDAGVEALLAAPQLAGLEHLDLRSTGLTIAGVRALAKSPRAAGLRTLRLGGLDPLTNEMLRALAGSPHLRNLEELHLNRSEGASGDSPGDAAVQALAASDTLAGLNALHIAGWVGLTDRGRTVLRERFAGSLGVLCWEVP